MSWRVLVLLLLVPRPAAPICTYVVDSLSRVRPKDAPGSLVEARIKAARNESEAFQLVVHGGDGGLKGVSVECTDLTGPEGRKLERDRIWIFREHFLEIKSPSPKSKESPGPVPDALIPFPPPQDPRAPRRASRFPSFPFDVAPGSNQPIWVEIRIPKDAAAGEYRGTLTVTAAGEKPTTTPLQLTVWDFTLPDFPTLRTNFGGLGRRLLTGHPGFTPDTPPYRELERRYAEAMAAHRLCPPIPPYLRPKVGADGAIDAKDTHAGLKAWIEANRITGYALPLLGDDPAGKDRARNVKYLQTTYAYLKEHGWEKLAYVWAVDDPVDAKGYEAVRKLAQLVHEAQPGLKVFCNQSPVPQNPDWGTLVGSVDLWAPLWPNFDAKILAERQKAGEEVWSSTAQCQGKPGEDTPFWELDFPLLNYRIPAWVSRRYELSGLLYWTLIFWPQGDLWTNPLTFKEYNGEGALFYPGADIGVDGPVASMRLKALRDGLEDYEYLALAGPAGAELAAKLAPSWTQWEKDPAKLAAAREALAQIILSKK